MKFEGRILKPVEEAVRPGGGGAPAIPGRFRTQCGDELAISSVLETWREFGDCRHGGGERYVRRHWYRALCSDDRIARIYFDRQARRGRPAAERWCLYAWETET